MIDQTAERALAQVLAGRLVTPVFQPVMDLEQGAVVGYEALARVAEGQLTQPAALFAAARAARRLTELDWLCRERSVEVARAGGVRYPLSLFVNAEPETLLDGDQDVERWGRFADVRCYAELTERALAAHPAALLRAVDQVREQDWGIALDDVGAEPQSLALLPVIRPDVIKLDLALLHSVPASPGDLTAARVLHSALSQAADTGAVVVAEGIETEQHLDLARAYGAQYGQGYLLGRPGPLPTELSSPARPVPLLSRRVDRSVLPGPFTAVAGVTGTRQVTTASLLEVARQLLAQAGQLNPAPVVLVCVSEAALLPEHLRGLLSALSGSPASGLVRAPSAAAQLTGPACATPATSTLRHATLSEDDPALPDFAVVVVGGYYTAAVVARRTLHPSSDSTWDMAFTFDAELVSAAAQTLLARMP